MNCFANASRHGDLIPREGLSYCEDDNTYTPYTFFVCSWACHLAERPKPVIELDAGELFNLLFQ